MKPKYLKLKPILFITTAIVFTVLTFYGCKKSGDLNKKDLTSEQIINELKNDNDFLNYTAHIHLLTTNAENKNYQISTSTSISEEQISESEFIKIFKEANDNNENSKTHFAKLMGFNNSNEFWALRVSINIALTNLLRRYDFRKITKTQWYDLINSAKSNSIIRAQASLKTFMLNPNQCIEQYKDCIDDADAQYAVEALGCAGWGALGWTVVGGVLFVGCEGLSYYHLRTMKRKCESAYKGCK